MKRSFARWALVALLTLPSVAGATSPYSIDFKLFNFSSYDALDVSVNYASANGGFAGAGDAVACTPNAALGATMAFNDVAPTLKSGAIRLSPFAGQVVLFTCTFDSNAGAPSAANFAISVTGWGPPTNTTSPVVVISRIQAQ
ncbi:MAG TPA: hypothetical protein VEL28_03925 [Candidatus Binatia bacterium]|nr:hypothetical protein [Candidatus Binatia bacterium]